MHCARTATQVHQHGPELHLSHSALPDLSEAIASAARVCSMVCSSTSQSSAKANMICGQSGDSEDWRWEGRRWRALLRTCQRRIILNITCASLRLDISERLGPARPSRRPTILKAGFKRTARQHWEFDFISNGFCKMMCGCILNGTHRATLS